MRKCNGSDHTCHPIRNKNIDISLDTGGQHEDSFYPRADRAGGIRRVEHHQRAPIYPDHASGILLSGGGALVDRRDRRAVSALTRDRRCRADGGELRIVDICPTVQERRRQGVCQIHR